MSTWLFIQVFILISWVTLMIDWLNAKRVERTIRAVAQTHKGCSHGE